MKSKMNKIIQNSKNIKIGWIGTGVMGMPMCSHLIEKGYSCYVYNRTYEKAIPLIEKGAIWCENPQLIASNTDIIFTMVGFPSDVENVYFGINGIFKNIKTDMILIDMTTTSPELAIKIYNTAKSYNAYALDAPVSGGDVGARNASLSIMVGGDKDIFDYVKPFLEIIGNNIIYHGPAGSGQHAKLANQILIANNMIGVCESLVYAERAGLNLSLVINSLSSGAASSWSVTNLAPKIVDDDMKPGFYVEHFVKDLEIATSMCEKMNIQLNGLNLAKELYKELINCGYAKLGTQALIYAVKKIAIKNNL